MTNIVEALRDRTFPIDYRDRCKAADEIERLRDEISSMKVAAQSAVEFVAEREREECEELRAEIDQMRASYAAIIQWLRGQGLLVRYSMCTRPDNTLGPAWVLRRVHSVAGDSCLGWHDDDPVAAVESALKVTR